MKNSKTAYGGWIKCSDRLPELFDQRVLLLDASGNVSIGCLGPIPTPGSKIYIRADSEGELAEITHWMPLPEPPKRPRRVAVEVKCEDAVCGECEWRRWHRMSECSLFKPNWPLRKNGIGGYVRWPECLAAEIKEEGDARD